MVRAGGSRYPPRDDRNVSSATSPFVHPACLFPAMLKSFDGGRLFGACFGTDQTPWVIALHGWARSHKDWHAVLGAKPVGTVPQPSASSAGEDAGELSAVALDLPGFGATPPPPNRTGSERSC